MVWAVVVLAFTALGLVTTFVSLYAVQLKARFKAQNDALTLELALKGCRDTIEGLKSQQKRTEAQLEVLRTALEEAEDALVDNPDAADLRKRLDNLLSGEVQEDNQGASESPDSM